MVTYRQSKATRARQVADSNLTVSHMRSFTLPAFGPDTFLIYYWPNPGPQSLPVISDTYLAWKIARDKVEGENHIDDGADDWYEFAGSVVDYENSERFYFTIASSVLARAKRAFRSGSAWSTFEQRERAFDPSAKAKVLRNPVARAKWMQEVLDNRLRLAIFNIIAERLCNEIWLEEYEATYSFPVKRDSKVDVIGGQTDKAALDSFSQSANESMPLYDEDGRQRPNPTGWLQDRHGVWQPTYGDETELPNGLDEGRIVSFPEQYVRGPNE